MYSLYLQQFRKPKKYMKKKMTVWPEKVNCQIERLHSQTQKRKEIYEKDGI